MLPALLQQPFFQVTLPLMFTFVGAIWVASWAQNKRFDDWTKRFEDLRSDMNRQFTDLRSDMNRRLDEIIVRLTRIEAKLDNHEERIVRLEERTSPLTRH